jgi:hypothetical protein
LARDEAKWLILHTSTPPPPDYRRYKQADIVDPRLCIALVVASERIADLLSRFAPAVEVRRRLASLPFITRIHRLLLGILCRVRSNGRHCCVGRCRQRRC